MAEVWIREGEEVTVWFMSRDGFVVVRFDSDGLVAIADGEEVWRNRLVTYTDASMAAKATG